MYTDISDDHHRQQPGGLMFTVYFSLLPLDYDRPGGVWWYRILNAPDVEDFVGALRPVAYAIRVSEGARHHDPMSIQPPKDATIVHSGPPQSNSTI